MRRGGGHGNKAEIVGPRRELDHGEDHNFGVPTVKFEEIYSPIKKGGQTGVGGCNLGHVTKINIGDGALGLPFFQDLTASLHEGFGREEQGLVLLRGILG